jgi:DNA-binding transcriptional MerR regulator
MRSVTAEYSLEQLAKTVQDWCAEHSVAPVNGQAADEISERTIRYYRTLGLLDPALGNYAKSFSEKHRLQLIAIRIYQAEGFPLRKIRDELYGKSLEDLATLENQVTHRGAKALSIAIPFAPPTAIESWSVVPLADEFLLMSRKNRQLPRTVIEKINKLLRAAAETNRS